MPTDTKQFLSERAQLVRLYEANSAVPHPSDEDLRFRRALMHALATRFGLRRDLVPQPPPPSASGPSPARRG